MQQLGFVFSSSEGGEKCICYAAFISFTRWQKNTGNASQCRLSNITLLVSSVISIMQLGERHHAAYKAVRVYGDAATISSVFLLPLHTKQCICGERFGSHSC